MKKKKEEDKKEQAAQPKEEKKKDQRKEQEARHEEGTKRKSFWKQKKVFLIAGLILVFFILPVSLYFYSPLGKLTYRFFRYLPYPVAMIDGNGIVSTKEMIAGAEAVKTFYQSQDFSEVGMRVDFSTEEGKMRLKIKEKDVLDKLIENKIIEKLAQERGITITTQDAQRELNQKINEAGDAKGLEVNLKKLYNWNLDDFRDKVVIPQLYLQKLTVYYFENNKQDQPGYQKIQKAKTELKKDGSNFEEVAKKYSEGSSAENGGELGWFRQEQLVPEVAKVAYEIKPKSISDVIQSSLGYHIINVQEIREVDASENQTQSNSVSNQGGKVKEVRLRQIFVSEGGFLDWLKNQKSKTKVYIWMKDYSWDSQAARVKFRNEKMNALERDLKFKAQGDPSMQ